jgi:hypothetical protein
MENPANRSGQLDILNNSVSFASQTPVKGQFLDNGIYRSGKAVGTAE